MSKTGASRGSQWVKQMPDAAISQVNPVSATLYPVLPTTANVEILAIATIITWAGTQPTPLEIVVTVDGRTRVFSVGNPVSGTGYAPTLNYVHQNEISQAMAILPVTAGHQQAFKACSGKSVKVEVRITWAVTQPTPLECRVKYAVLG